MKHSLTFSSIPTFFLCCILLVTSCKKDKPDSIVITPPPSVTPPASIIPPVNYAPIANAGLDQAIILPLDSVELRGSATDINGTIVSYEWSKLRGPSQFTFLSNNSAITKVIKLVEGKYEFELKATDNSALTAKDTVSITVLISGFDPCYGCWDY